MKQKAEIIKTVDINEDYAILIVKKIKETPKLCKDCTNLKYSKYFNVHYCSKYEGIVKLEDICIEVGM